MHKNGIFIFSCLNTLRASNGVWALTKYSIIHLVPSRLISDLKSNPPLHPASSDNNGGRRGFCQLYRGLICARYLEGKYIFVTSSDQQIEIEINLRG